MKLSKFLVLCEYADPEQYDQLPDDIVWEDDEQQVFAWDEDAKHFVQFRNQTECETVKLVTPL